MMNLVYISIGAVSGAILRYLVSMYLPLPILIVNLLGSFIIGLFSFKFATNDNFHLFLSVGLLGSFTTFSAFSLEIVQAMQSGLSWRLFAYLCLKVSLCLAACFAGVRLAHLMP